MRRISQVAIISLLAISFGFSAAGCALFSQVAQAPTPTARVTLPAISTKPASAPRVTPTPNVSPDANAIDLGLSGGIVTSNNGSALGLRLADTPLQVQTNASTIIVVPGLKNAQLADIHIGDRVIANMHGNDANAPATLLLDLPASYTASDIVTGVVIASVNGVLAVRTDTLPRRVSVNAATRVVDISGDRPAVVALGDAQANNAVMVIGQGSGDAFTAQVVVIAVKDVRNIPSIGK